LFWKLQILALMFDTWLKHRRDRVWPRIRKLGSMPQFFAYTSKLYHIEINIPERHRSDNQDEIRHQVSVRMAWVWHRMKVSLESDSRQPGAGFYLDYPICLFRDSQKELNGLKKAKYSPKPQNRVTCELILSYTVNHS
jgi:hypothetical protein